MTISVGAIIYHEDKYLLQKRDNKKNIFFPNLWGVFGGTIEKNEKPIDGIKRELKEELNLNFKITKEFLKQIIETKYFKPQRTRLFFICKLPNDFKKIIKLNEGADLKFFNLHQINSLRMVPWDFSAILYHNYSIVLKKRVKPI